MRSPLALATLRTPQFELIRLPTFSTSRLSWNVCTRARDERDVLQHPQVDVAVPRIQRAESLGDLAAMLCSGSVLLDEGIEAVHCSAA